MLGQTSVLMSKHGKDLSDGCLPYPVAVPEIHKAHHRMGRGAGIAQWLEHRTRD